MLLGYYTQKCFTDKAIKQKREKYILWLIANHPEAGVLGCPYATVFDKDEILKAKKLWMEQLEKHPDNIAILDNIGHIFSYVEPDVAITCFKKLINLAPNNSRMWYWNLGNIYNGNGKSKFGKDGKRVAPKDAIKAFENAFEAYQNAYIHSTDKEKETESSFILSPLAYAALNANKLDKAEEYANKLLAAAKTDKKDCQLIYTGNCILGLIAVKNGNIDTAEKYLLKSVEFPPETRGFNPSGPDWRLTRELLAKGKRDTVLEFLKKCSLFWKYNGICDQLIKEMENGKTPDLSIEGMMNMNMNMKMTKPKANVQNNKTAQQPIPATDTATVQATTAAGKWLALVDAGKYQESWTESAAYFKAAVTVSAWEQAMKAVRVPLGKLLSRKVKSAVCHTSLPGAPDGRYVVIQFETSFENKKDATETVTPMLDKDGQWRVSGYYIK